MSLPLSCAERGLLPDVAIRAGIRNLLRKRIDAIQPERGETCEEVTKQFAETLKTQPIALLTDQANDQHYEVPTDFFERMLGPRLKYSSCLWPQEGGDLRDAEEMMLAVTCTRADIHDGMRILELGCGWGSLTLWMAEHYHMASIVAVTNSASQKEHIDRICNERGWRNVQVIKRDMNDLESPGMFDRVISIEMFEHMRNYELLLRRIQSWLNSNGKLFVHIFCHRELPYTFEDDGEDDWMARFFFSGGIMPSSDLLQHFQDDLTLDKHYLFNGTHYARTLEAWLDNMDVHREEIVQIFSRAYGEREAHVWFQRWRMFLMASAELFAYRNGTEWMIGHYLFGNNAGA